MAWSCSSCCSCRPADDSARARLDQRGGASRQRASADAPRLLEPLVAEAEAAGDGAVLMEALHHSGDGPAPARRLSRKRWSSDRRALELSRRLGDRSFEARILRNMALTLEEQRRLSRGAGPRGRVARPARGARERRKESGRAAITLGGLHDLRGEYRLALERYAQAEAALRETEGRDYLLRS